MYRDVVACGEKPVANKVEACNGIAKVKPVGLRKKIHTREQLITNAMICILQVSLGLAHGAKKHTLGKWVTKRHTHMYSKNK